MAVEALCLGFGGKVPDSNVQKAKCPDAGSGSKINPLFRRSARTQTFHIIATNLPSKYNLCPSRVSTRMDQMVYLLMARYKPALRRH
jgi:hypothetical protein